MCQGVCETSYGIRWNSIQGDIPKQIASEVKQATASGAFRKYEQVSDVYVTLEPFAMVNGLLTQSYKVKRDFVAKRYQDELPK